MTTTSVEQHREAAEALLTRIRGVLAARVVFGPNDIIDEVHLVASPQRNPKQIVRDAESLLYVRLHLRVDYRKISLVQVEEQSFRPPSPRVRLGSVRADEGEYGPQVRIQLLIGDLVIEGIGQSRPGQPGIPLELSAYATLHAINQLPGLSGTLYLEHVERHAMPREDVCIVSLGLQSDLHHERLLGIAAAQNDEAVAVSRAVLDAVNRRLASWLEASPR